MNVMKRICVFNINWLGDAVFSVPVFTALRHAYPKAHIACVCVNRVADVLQYCDSIDEIIILDEKKQHRSFWKKLQFIGLLRAKKFDTAYLLHHSFSRLLMVWLAGIEQRIGFSKFPWWMTLPVASGFEELHRMDNYLRVVEASGIQVIDRTYRLTPPPDKELVRDQYVVFNTGGNWDLKRWPQMRWVELAGMFKGGPCRVIFSGAKDDFIDAQMIIEKSGVIATNLCGQTTLGESLTLFAKAQVVISADSGPLHLANSVGAKVIGLFGPTQPIITGPRGNASMRIVFKNCGCNKSACYHLNCSDNVCMKGLSAEDVYKAYQELI